MPRPSKATIDQFSAAAQSALEADGWKKRRGDVYTLERGTCLGWLGLNRATKRLPMKVNPVVGVRHNATETIVAELLGEKPHGYIPPTISVPVGYLRPENKYYEITVVGPEDAPRAARELADLVQTYALSFIEQHSTSASIAGALGRRLSANAPEYRAPIALALSGDLEGARAAIDEAVGARAERSDAEAERYRAYARAAIEWLDAGGRQATTKEA